MWDRIDIWIPVIFFLVLPLLQWIAGIVFKLMQRAEKASAERAVQRRQERAAEQGQTTWTDFQSRDDAVVADDFEEQEDEDWIEHEIDHDREVALAEQAEDWERAAEVRAPMPPAPGQTPTQQMLGEIGALLGVPGGTAVAPPSPGRAEPEPVVAPAKPEKIVREPLVEHVRYRGKSLVGLADKRGEVKKTRRVRRLRAQDIRDPQELVQVIAWGEALAPPLCLRKPKVNPAPFLDQ